MEYAVFEGNLTRRWQRSKEIFKEIRSEDEGEKTFWQSMRETLRDFTKAAIEVCLDEELTEQVQAKFYERAEGRRAYRNGHYERDLDTENRPVRGIRVPRLRRGRFKTQVFERYQRRQAEVNQAVLKAFVCGVSTRRVEETLEPLLGIKISAGGVSRVTKVLDQAVRRYHGRRILDQYQYLFLDGITVKIRAALKVKTKLVLVAYGITVFGERELIDFCLTQSESEAKWEMFLYQLRRRGLEGKELRLVTTDGCKGLHKALDTIYPEVPRQRCWAHKLRNVANKVPRKLQAECTKGARKIYLASNRRQAVRAFRQWDKQWRKIAPKAVECLARDMDELLPFLEVPEKHRKMVRTTNAIERSFREVRRRVRPMSSFPTPDSCERIVYSVFAHLNNKWKDHPLALFTQFR